MARERLYGRWALRFKNVLKLQFLLESQDFVSITAFLKQLLEKNYWDPRDFNLIIIDSQRFTAQFKQKVLNTFFQVLQFPQICFAPSSLCVLSALGQDSGLIVDIGFSSTTVEAVYKNFPNDESKFELPIGGFHLTQRLTDLIFSKFEYENNYSLFWVAEDIKRTSALAVSDANSELLSIDGGNTDYNQNVELPDGTMLTINSERFLCIEPLFDPDILHIRSDNLIDLIGKSIRAWDLQKIPELVQKIILCGNGAKIEGLANKIEMLVKQKFAKTLNVKVIPVEEYKKVFWIGASVLSQKGAQFEWIPNPQSSET